MSNCTRLKLKISVVILLLFHRKQAPNQNDRLCSSFTVHLCLMCFLGGFRHGSALFIADKNIPADAMSHVCHWSTPLCTSGGSSKITSAIYRPTQTLQLLAQVKNTFLKVYFCAACQHAKELASLSFKKKTMKKQINKQNPPHPQNQIKPNQTQPNKKKPTTKPSHPNQNKTQQALPWNYKET